MLGFGSFSEGRCSGSEASRKVRDHGEAEGGEVEQVERVLPQVTLKLFNERVRGARGLPPLDLVQLVHQRAARPAEAEQRVEEGPAI